MLRSEIYQEAMKCVLNASACSHEEIIEIIDVLLQDRKSAQWGEEHNAKKGAGFDA